jgi:hypothetical protein
MMSELMKTPEELAATVIRKIDNYCPSFGDHKGGRETNLQEDCPCGSYKTAEYRLAKYVLADHANLLRIAEAAEAYKQSVEYSVPTAFTWPTGFFFYREQLVDALAARNTK